MNYDDPELRDRLAAEYVLGTLRGRARDRFERLLLSDRALHTDVQRWERQLNPMALALPPREPARRVWRGIRARIRPRPARAGWFWPTATGVATATAAVLAIYLAVTPPVTRTLEPDYVAAIGAEADGPAWSISAHVDERRVSIRAVRAADIESGNDLELWLLPSGGAAPISLGLLPESGKTRSRIPQDAVAAVADATGIAISREPTGGSPTGAPTGPILYQGRLIPL